MWNPIIVSLTAVCLLGACFPTAIACSKAKTRDGKTSLLSDPDYLLLIQNSVLLFLALIIMALTIHGTHMVKVARGVAWSLFGGGLLAMIISLILYATDHLGWSIFLSFVGAAANAMITLQLIFVTEVVAGQVIAGQSPMNEMNEMNEMGEDDMELSDYSDQA